jgi:hypothetical protein
MSSGSKNKSCIHDNEYSFYKGMIESESVGYDSRDVFLHCLGLILNQRRKARENALTSEYPSISAISEIES